jgi:hypothetical protein
VKTAVARAHATIDQKESKRETSQFWKDDMQDRILSTFQTLAYSNINSYAEIKSDARLDDFTYSVGKNQHEPFYVDTFFRKKRWAVNNWVV